MSVCVVFTFLEFNLKTNRSSIGGAWIFGVVSLLKIHHLTKGLETNQQNNAHKQLSRKFDCSWNS